MILGLPAPSPAIRRALAGAALTLLAASAGAQEVMNIAAVVNDEVISMYDLRARSQLIVASAGLPDSLDTRRRIEPQVLRSLIDEKLQLQEAKRLNIAVSNDEIKEAYGQIEEQNRIPAGKLVEQLSRARIDVSSLEAQTRAAIAWSKIVRRQIRNQIQVGNEEVDEAVQRLEAGRGKPQSLVSEIFLAVDSVDQEDPVRAAAGRLLEQIKGGAPFEAMARQFSQGASAQQGGDVGWVAEGDLPEELDRAAGDMKPGETSEPIRSIAGYHILRVRERRIQDLPGVGDSSVSLRYIYMRLPPGVADPEVKSAHDLARLVRDTVADCADMARLRKEVDATPFPLPETVKIGELAGTLRSVVSTITIGKASDPIEIGGGLLVLMVCTRDEPKGMDRARIEDVLVSQRMDVQMRRYMRDLRKAAFVDIRA